jgi:anthranilate phosphoribosyltransferase
VAQGDTLTETEAADTFGLIMSGAASDAQIGALLMGMRARGETVDEITGAARAMRERAVKVRAPAGAIDTCGTGGDAKDTHNISTCAAFVVAGAGVPVAKHGNRSISSRSGSADVLKALGVNIECGPETIAKCIEGSGLGFMFAPSHHAAMRHVAKVRAELGARTIVNLLGPLANPAGAKYQIVGVFSQALVEPIAHVLVRLGVERAWVVHGRAPDGQARGFDRRRCGRERGPYPCCAGRKSGRVPRHRAAERRGGAARRRQGPDAPRRRGPCRRVDR